MRSDEWNAWAAKHATIFGLTSDSDGAMFLAWREVFARSGFAPEELDEATVYLASTSPPRWRTEHLSAITGRIVDRRRAAILAAQRQATAEYDYHRGHEVCGGTGWVYVPHLSCVRDGEWIAPWYTVVVLCDCKRGQRIREVQANSKTKAGEARPVSLGLEAYMLQNADWKGQLRRRAEVVKASIQAHSVTEHTDRKLGIVGAEVQKALQKLQAKKAAEPVEQAPAEEVPYECPF